MGDDVRTYGLARLALELERLGPVGAEAAARLEVMARRAEGLEILEVLIDDAHGRVDLRATANGAQLSYLPLRGRTYRTENGTLLACLTSTRDALMGSQNDREVGDATEHEKPVDERDLSAELGRVADGLEAAGAAGSGGDCQTLEGEGSAESLPADEPGGDRQSQRAGGREKTGSKGKKRRRSGR